MKELNIGDPERVHLQILRASDEGLDGILQGVMQVLLTNQLHVGFYRLGGHAVPPEEQVLILSY